MSEYGVIAIKAAQDCSCEDALCLQPGIGGDGLTKTKIGAGDDCFLDTLREDRKLCANCGPCVRYVRKRHVQRGGDLNESRR